MKMVDIYRCAIGPQLHRIFARNRVESRPYEANGVERFGAGIIRALSLAWSVCYSTSLLTGPVLGFYLIRKGFLSQAGLASLSRFLGTTLVVVFGALCLRGYGRSRNEEYRVFLALLEETKTNNNAENKRKLGCYDFDFSAWPVDYKWDKEKAVRNSQTMQEETSHSRPAGLLSFLGSWPCDFLRYFVAHSVGRPLIYPGSTGLLQSGLSEPLLTGRTYLIEHKGERAKLETADGNEIDTMFMDKRSSPDIRERGDTLVITCEGNAGFYEVGLITTPFKAGYSVLGWNHPGFGGSSGLPSPESEKNAIEVVMQYAIEELGFPVNKIFIYAWSIGGYPAVCGAKVYPQIGGMVLDATFDDIVPLAQTKMPDSICNFTTRVVKEYFHLDIARLLCSYPGPVLMIRRMRDEIISTENGDIRSNRGNDLLLKFLKFRYPNLLNSDCEDALLEYLAAPDQNTKSAIWNSLNVDTDHYRAVYKNYTDENGKGFPMMIGQNMTTEERIQLLMFLVLQYHMDFDATHCVSLPASTFRLPWNEQ
ncbi:phosphatidylserine lipase ABHD16A-like [Acropora millepora]|uniref:phosphatidylserine lipase ABHD16A-like n=1 Tax=Acropora millepora TaxID=45264 RepID=UPI001CF1C10C|nr:phosphatidylserine lipase ABHD16A-like [Acropora millepora]